MRGTQFRPSLRALLPAMASLLMAATPDAGTFEVSIAAGAGFARAEFRVWLPPKLAHLRAVVVLMPGSNQDGRSQIDDLVWRAFATRNDAALLGCYFEDRAHDFDFIEQYSDASKGSGAALTQALQQLSAAAKQPALASAPLLLWGFSAGGQFNFEFAAWQPERVAAFVVNKGGVYFSALTPAATRAVPAMLFVGERDLPSRTTVVEGLFALNRRAGALWSLVHEPGVSHELGQSRELGMLFLEDSLALRRQAGSSALRAASLAQGYSGDPLSRRIIRAASAANAEYPSVWLPSERVAKAWLAVISGHAITAP